METKNINTRWRWGEKLKRIFIFSTFLCKYRLHEMYPFRRTILGDQLFEIGTRRKYLSAIIRSGGWMKSFAKHRVRSLSLSIAGFKFG
ncbi:MAG: hypothetical protein DI535_14575 [Citrobacter freundii]|nr:MAG: hypothetical protein DI535_14575 [Citrobacter freundii]